jgi:hypothetical protein
LRSLPVTAREAGRMPFGDNERGDAPGNLKAHPRAADLPRLWASGLLGELLARQGEAMVRITGWPSWAAPAPACRMTY